MSSAATAAKKRRAVPGSWERYYEVVEVGDTVVRVAPNGVCVVALAARHPAVGRATKIEFSVALHVDFSGKKKKGAMQVAATTNLCRIECADGSEVAVAAGVGGKLMEINHDVAPPDLVDGYLAIVQASPLDLKRLRGEEPPESESPRLSKRARRRRFLEQQQQQHSKKSDHDDAATASAPAAAAERTTAALDVVTTTSSRVAVEEETS